MAHPFARFVGELFPQLPSELFDIPETFTPLTPAGIAPQVGPRAVMRVCPPDIISESARAQTVLQPNRRHDDINLGALVRLSEMPFRMTPASRLLPDKASSHALARRSAVALASSITSAPASASPARRSAMRPATRSAAWRSAASSLWM